LLAPAQIPARAANAPGFLARWGVLVTASSYIADCGGDRRTTRMTLKSYLGGYYK
jgi:hypothetical protein